MTGAVAMLAAKCSEIDLVSLASVRPTGVYILIDRGVAVYVGQSTDVPTRIRWHIADGGKAFDRAIWFEVHERDLAAYEGALIRALDPRHNLGVPSDASRDSEVLAVFGLAVDDGARDRFFARRRLAWGGPRSHRRTKAGRAIERRARIDDARSRQRERAQRLWAAIGAAYLTRAS